MNRSLIKVAKVATSILCYLLGLIAAIFLSSETPVNWIASAFLFLIVEIITCFIALNSRKNLKYHKEFIVCPGIIFFAYIMMGMFNYYGLAITKNSTDNLAAIYINLYFIYLAYDDNVFY